MASFLFKRLVVRARKLLSNGAATAARVWRSPTPSPGQTDPETQEMLQGLRKALIDGEFEQLQCAYRKVSDFYP